MTFFVLCILTCMFLHLNLYRIPIFWIISNFMLWHIHSCFNGFIDMLYCILSTDEQGSWWRRLCRCWLHQGLSRWQPLVRPAAMESLPWRQPFPSIIECMCDVPMYRMYILSYIELSQKWRNKDDQTKKHIEKMMQEDIPWKIVSHPEITRITALSEPNLLSLCLGNSHCWYNS